MDVNETKMKFSNSMQFAQTIQEGLYSILKKGNPIKYTLQVQELFFKGQKSKLCLVHDLNFVENMHRKTMEAKWFGQLIRSLAHDFKTPLTIIKAHIGSLSCCDEQERREHIEAVTLSTEGLEYLLYGVIDAQQLINKSLTLTPKPTDIRSLLDRIQKLASTRAKLKNLPVNLINSCVNHHFICDDRRLMQMLLNLTENAVKYTDKGSVTITATEEAPGIKIVIEDTGIGIDSERLQNIFTLFGSAEVKEAKSETGVGIGLYLCKNIAKLMKGDLVLTSTPGCGTRAELTIGATVVEEGKCHSGLLKEATITTKVTPQCPKSDPLQPIVFHTLPISEAEKTGMSAGEKEGTSAPLFHQTITSPRKELCGENTDRKFAVPEESPDPPVPSEPIRVLVVDDDALILHALAALLKKLSCVVDTAPNGTTAIELVKKMNDAKKDKGSKSGYKLILMDINMPGMNGYDTTKELNSLMNSGVLQKVPIICVSAQDGQGHQDKCAEAGFTQISKILFYAKVLRFMSAMTLFRRNYSTHVMISRQAGFDGSIENSHDNLRLEWISIVMMFSELVFLHQYTLEDVC